MFLGFAGQGFKKSEQVLLKPGQQATVGDYTIRMDALRVTQDDQKQMVTGHFTAFEGGKEIGKMYPARWFFNKHEEPTTEVAIRRMWGEDLYLVLPSYQVSDQSASVDIVVNPLINWIWVGFAVMAFGTGIVLLPERTFAFAMAKFPAEVATTTGMLLLMASLATPGVCAGTRAGQNVPLVPEGSTREAAAFRDRLHVRVPARARQLRHAQLRRPRGAVGEDSRADGRRARSRRHHSPPSSATYGGQDILIEPLDEGFNRLAWFFPYAIGGLGAIAGVFVVRKWSRRVAAAAAGFGRRQHRLEDAALQARLDRELEDLD